MSAEKVPDIEVGEVISLSGSASGGQLLYARVEEVYHDAAGHHAYRLSALFVDPACTKRYRMEPPVRLNRDH